MEWKKICDRIESGNLEGIWKFETSDMQVIKSYFECDAEILEYLEKAEKNDIEIVFTLFINEEREAAEYAIGVWGADVKFGIDNRTYQEDDYEGVIKWLNKQAGDSIKEVEEAIKKRDAETLKEMIKDGVISMEDVEEAINNEEQKYHANFDDFRFSIDVLDNELKSLNKLKRKIREEEE